jgi:Pentapeptide repeats (8 copies)/Fibronectin type III domain
MMVADRPTSWFAVRRLLGVALAGIAVLAVVLVGFSPSTAAKTPKLKNPGSPTSVVVEPVDGGAVVSWGPPGSDGGTPVTGYAVSVGSVTRGFTCSTTSEMTCTVHGLINGRQYRAKVRAVNAVGQGKPAESAKFVPGRSADCSDFQPNAVLTYCNLVDANLSGLDLTGVDFYGSRLVGANFSGANLSGAFFGGDTGAQEDLTGADFSDATMVGTTLDTMYLYTVSFVGANLTDADLSDSTMIFDSFANANLTGANLAGQITFPTWSNTICPDGVNSDDAGGTCDGHFL